MKAETLNVMSRLIPAFALLSALAFVTVHAAEVEKIPTIAITDVPLASAIGNLAAQSELNYILDPRVLGSGFEPGQSLRQPTVTARWTNVTARHALNELLGKHGLIIITNQASSILRIAATNAFKKLDKNNTATEDGGAVMPRIVMDFLPLTVAMKNLGAGAKLDITFDPKLAAALDQRGMVSLSWRNVTIRQALAALLDNFDLVMTVEKGAATARVTANAGPTAP